MTAVITASPKYTFVSTAGVPLASGSVTVYEAGTVTPSNTWQDRDQNTLNVNPISLDSRGTALIWLDPAKRYDFVVKNAGGVTQYTVEDVEGAIGAASLVASTGSALVGFKHSLTGAATITLQTKALEIASYKADCGAAMNGSNDDAALAKAVAAAQAAQIKALWIPAGTSAVSTAQTITLDRFSIYGEGPRNSGFSVTAEIDLFTFTSATPASDRISDITIKDIFVDYGGLTGPSDGQAFTFIRADRTRLINVDVRNCFQGIEIRGGADIKLMGVTIGGSPTWSAVEVGSYLLKLSFFNSGGTTEVPSEITVSDFNIKGSDSTSYAERSIWIECGDGLYFSNGHCGFANDSSLDIIMLNNANAFLTELMFSNVHFDGNSNGDTTRGNVSIEGSTTPEISGLLFSNCVMKIFDGAGFWNGLTSMRNLQLVNCHIRKSGEEAIRIDGGVGIIINGCSFEQNNRNNTSANCVEISNATEGTITGCRVGDGTNAHPVGIYLHTNANSWAITGNVMDSGHTKAFDWLTCNYITHKNNRLVAGTPSCVAADPLVPPMGFDIVKVTGNTNFTNITAQNNEGAEVTFWFTGTPTVTDGGNMKLAGNFVATANSTLTLINNGTDWIEKCRAIV